MTEDSGQTSADLDRDTGEGSLGKPAPTIASQGSSVNAVATQLTNDVGSSSEDEGTDEAFDHEENNEEGDKVLEGVIEEEEQDKEVYDEDTAGPLLEIAPGVVDVGELPEIELEPSDVIEDESNVMPDSSLKPILETERLTISVSSEHESDNEDARSRSDRADTISVKSSSSSHAESESVTKSVDVSVAASETAATAQFLHTVTESESESTLKEETSPSTIQKNEGEMEPVTDAKNEELESCQTQLQELRAKLEQYESARDAEKFESELEAKQRENEELRRTLEERNGALEEAKTRQEALGDQIKTLETRREEETALRQGEVSQLEASVAALKLELEQKALLVRDEASALEKNGLPSGNRTSQSRTSLRPSSGVKQAQKKPSKVCVLL